MKNMLKTVIAAAAVFGAAQPAMAQLKAPMQMPTKTGPGSETIIITGTAKPLFEMKMRDGALATVYDGWVAIAGAKLFPRGQDLAMYTDPGEVMTEGTEAENYKISRYCVTKMKPLLLPQFSRRGWYIPEPFDPIPLEERPEAKPFNADQIAYMEYALGEVVAQLKTHPNGALARFNFDNLRRRLSLDCGDLTS